MDRVDRENEEKKAQANKGNNKLGEATRQTHQENFRRAKAEAQARREPTNRLLRRLTGYDPLPPKK